MMPREPSDGNTLEEQLDLVILLSEMLATRGAELVAELRHRHADRGYLTQDERRIAVLMQAVLGAHVGWMSEAAPVARQGESVN